MVMKEFIVKEKIVKMSVEDVIKQFRAKVYILTNYAYSKLKGIESNSEIYNTHDREDIESSLNMQLVKIYRDYDISYGCALSTFAFKRLEGHTTLIIRDTMKARRTEGSRICDFKNESIYNVKYDSKGRNDIYIIDSVIDEKTIIERETDSEIFNKLDYAMRNFDEKEKFIIEKLMDGKTQDVIGGMLGISQVQVSRLLKKIRKKILNASVPRIETNIQVEETPKILIDTNFELKKREPKKSKIIEPKIKLIESNYEGYFNEYTVRNDSVEISKGKQHVIVEKNELDKLIQELNELRGVHYGKGN